MTSEIGGGIEVKKSLNTLVDGLEVVVTMGRVTVGEQRRRDAALAKHILNIRRCGSGGEDFDSGVDKLEGLVYAHVADVTEGEFGHLLGLFSFLTKDKPERFAVFKEKLRLHADVDGKKSEVLEARSLNV